MELASQQDRLLKLAEVIAIAGISRSEIYVREAEGRFPRRIALSPTTTRWSELEVRAWVEERKAARDSDAEQRQQTGKRLREARVKSQERTT